MASDTKIGECIQAELRRRGLSEVTAIEAARWLEEAHLLADSKSRPGANLRRLLRKKKITGGRHEINRRHFIDRVDLQL